MDAAQQAVMPMALCNAIFCAILFYLGAAVCIALDCSLLAKITYIDRHSLQDRWVWVLTIFAILGWLTVLISAICWHTKCCGRERQAYTRQIYRFTGASWVACLASIGLSTAAIIVAIYTPGDPNEFQRSTYYLGVTLTLAFQAAAFVAVVQSLTDPLSVPDARARRDEARVRHQSASFVELDSYLCLLWISTQLSLNS